MHDLARRRSLLLVRPLPRARARAPRACSRHARRSPSTPSCRPRSAGCPSSSCPARTRSSRDARRGRDRRRELVQSYMTWDEDNRRSLRASVARRANNARSIREVVSLEAVADSQRASTSGSSGPTARDDYDASTATSFYRRVRASGRQLCARPAAEHDAARHAARLHLARRAARARSGQTARVARRAPPRAHDPAGPQHQVVDTALWLSLLRACSGFRAVHEAPPGGSAAPAVAAFLILEPSVPARSIRYWRRRRPSTGSAAIRPPGAAPPPGPQTPARFGELDEWLARADAVRSIEGPRSTRSLTHIVDETAARVRGPRRRSSSRGWPRAPPRSRPRSSVD